MGSIAALVLTWARAQGTNMCGKFQHVEQRKTPKPDFCLDSEWSQSLPCSPLGVLLAVLPNESRRCRSCCTVQASLRRGGPHFALGEALCGPLRLVIPNRNQITGMNWGLRSREDSSAALPRHYR